MLTIAEMARLYRTTEGAIRAAIWRARHFGTDPGFPMPILIRGRYRWLKSSVCGHVGQLMECGGTSHNAQIGVCNEESGGPPMS